MVPEMLAMLISAVLGGYGAARIARYLPPNLIRLFVLGLSSLVTVGFFLRHF